MNLVLCEARQTSPAAAAASGLFIVGFFNSQMTVMIGGDHEQSIGRGAFEKNSGKSAVWEVGKCGDGALQAFSHWP
jgi:hypothetical protein